MRIFLVFLLIAQSGYCLNLSSITKKPLIIQHRTNHLGSLNLAIENHAQAVEVDVQITADNVVVLYHDKEILTQNGLLKTCEATYAQMFANNATLLKFNTFLGILKRHNIMAIVHINNRFTHILKYDMRMIYQIMLDIYDNSAVSLIFRFISFDIKQLVYLKTVMPWAKTAYCVDRHDYGFYAVDLHAVISRERFLSRMRIHRVDEIVFPLPEHCGTITNGESVSAYMLADISKASVQNLQMMRDITLKA